MSNTVPPPRRAKAERTAPARASSPPGAIALRTAGAVHAASAQRRSYLACFQHFVTEARKIPANEVLSCPGDVRLALANVRIGLDAVCGDPAEVAAHLPRMPIEQALESADVARALVHADGLAAKAPVNREERRVVVRRVAKHRRLLVAAAPGLAEHGALPASEVAKLGRQRGERGMVDDAIFVAELYTTHADAIRGMHPFSQHDIDQLRADAEWLRENTSPRGLRKRAVARVGAPDDDRNRLWTLLVRRHAMLQRIAGYFHGNQVDAYVPPLRSRTRRAMAVEEESAPAPAPLVPTPAPIG